jgi:hypothetical protein
LAPCGREDLAEIHLVEVNAPVFIAHPPGAVVTENIIKFFLETLIVIPSLVFISESALPDTLSLAPRVSDVN